MTEKRVNRARLLDTRLSGGASSALGRRTGQKTEPRTVVEYFGEDADTPAIEMLKAVRPNAQSFRDGSFIHVSDVISKCVRKIAIMRRMNLRHPQESIMDGQGITFAIGETIHDYVKDKFVRGHPEKVWAKWTCACGDSSHTGTFSSIPKTKCQTCNLEIRHHNEVSFVDEEYRLRGTPDVLLWMDQYGAFYVLELKSMAAESWKELVRPLPDHVVQVSLYWHLLRRLGHPVVDRVSLLYVNKEFSFKFPYKEFMVDPTKVDLSAYWGDLDALKEADGGGPLPARITCGDSSAPEAKKCPVCVTCFGCD